MQLKLSQDAPTLQEIKWSDFTNGKVAAAFFGIFQGRCTFAALLFSVFGVYGWLQGRDLTSYAMFVTAVQGLLVLHSWKEDVSEQQQVANERAGKFCKACGAEQSKNAN